MASSATDNHPLWSRFPLCVGAGLLSLTFSQLRLYRARNLLRFRKVVTVIVSVRTRLVSRRFPAGPDWR